MTINTRKHTSTIHCSRITVTAVAFVLTIVAVNASFAQSPNRDRDDPQSSAKQQYRLVTSNVIFQQPTLVIDSFKVGPFATPPVAIGMRKAQTTLDETEVIGGSRTTILQITNPDQQPVSFEVRTSKPALIYSAGYNVSPGLEIHYKIPAVSADLVSKYDRFLIDFDGLNHGMLLTIVAFGVDKKIDGHTGDGCKILPPPDGPFTLSFPFSHFTGDVLKTTTDLAFIFGATSRGLDYAITGITAAQGDPVGKHIVTCSK